MPIEIKIDVPEPIEQQNVVKPEKITPEQSDIAAEILKNANIEEALDSVFVDSPADEEKQAQEAQAAKQDGGSGDSEREEGDGDGSGSGDTRGTKQGGDRDSSGEKADGEGDPCPEEHARQHVASVLIGSQWIDVGRPDVTECNDIVLLDRVMRGDQGGHQGDQVESRDDDQTRDRRAVLRERSDSELPLTDAEFYLDPGPTHVAPRPDPRGG